MKHLRIIIFFMAAGMVMAAEPPNAVDHAGILQSQDNESLERGKVIYESLCTNCHGADGITPPLPLARAFGNGEMKFGADPYSMFLTLTNGNGLMGPQTWMTPKERYDVIYFIREKFMRAMRDDFKEINDGYLEELPTVNVVVAESDKVKRNFGPALASQLGREIPSVLSVALGEETTISYNLHRMDQAGLWRGEFLDLLNTHHYRERGAGVAEPGGQMVAGLQGWRWGHDGLLDYPETDLLPRGPMPIKWLDYRGHYLHDNRVVLSYAIDGREILEMPSAAPRFGAVLHNFKISAGEKRLLLCVAEPSRGAKPMGFLDPGALTVAWNKGNSPGLIAVSGIPEEGGIGDFGAAALVGDTAGLKLRHDRKGRTVLEIPASRESRGFQVIRHAGKGQGELLSFASYVRSQIAKEKLEDPASMLRGGDLRWPGELVTNGELGAGDKAYTLDTIDLPPNDAGTPWNVWFRTSEIAFFPDGRMAVATHGGDVWIVSGVDAALKGMRWKRFAAGMYEPFGLQIIDGLVYVTCKDRITRLHDQNGDGEADFYESFSADEDVSTFFHAFNLELQRDKAGNIYYAKAGQYTSHALPGAIIKISPDGKKREVYCTGFRTPNGMGMMPDGRFTVSDNQGNWMPASKISLCKPGGFYGYVQTHTGGEDWAPDGGVIDHEKVVPPKTFDQPLIWMPQEFDNSSGSQLWVDDPRWGPLSGRMLHTSFGKGWLSYMMIQDFGDTAQAAIVKLDLDCDTGIHRAKLNPADGQVYAVGLNGWNGFGRKGLSQGGIHRFRYTGAPSYLLTDVTVETDGIRLRFNFELSPEALQEKERYRIEQWNYLWSEGYGSKQYSLKDEWEEGHDSVVIDKIIPSDGGRSVLLKISNIQPVNQVEINLDLVAADGRSFKEQAYLTINKVPDKGPSMKELTAERTFLWKRLKEEKANIIKQKQKDKKKREAKKVKEGQHKEEGEKG